MAGETITPDDVATVNAADIVAEDGAQAALDEGVRIARKCKLAADQLHEAFEERLRFGVGAEERTAIEKALQALDALT